MARIRTIKPDFFKNDVLAELPIAARMLFVGLWCLADCAGRLADRPKRIKVEIFPYEDVDIDELLSQLQSAGFISRYEAGDVKVIQVLTFLKHQRITGSEATAVSQLPPQPEDCVEELGEAAEELRGAAVKKVVNAISLLPHKAEEREDLREKFTKEFKAGSNVNRMQSIGLHAAPT